MRKLGAGPGMKGKGNFLGCMLFLGLSLAGIVQALAAPGSCTPADGTITAASRVDGPGHPLPEAPVTEVALNSWVGIRSAQFVAVRNEAACRGKDILLYLNGLPMKGLTFAFQPGDTAYVQLRRLASNRDAWAAILGSPTFEPPVSVRVALGIDGEAPIVAPTTFTISPLAGGRVLLGCTVFGLILTGFIFLVRRSNVLRDRSPPEDSVAVVNGILDSTKPVADRGPYSIARVQAAWWFLIIIASYLLIGIVTWDFHSSISSTALILLGIGAGTVVSGAVIDTSKDTEDNRDKLASRAAELLARIREIEEADLYLRLEMRSFEWIQPRPEGAIAPSDDEVARLRALKEKHADPEVWLRSRFGPICQDIADTFALRRLSAEFRALPAAQVGQQPNEPPPELTRLRSIYASTAMLSLCEAKVSGSATPPLLTSISQMLPLQRLSSEKRTAISRYRKATYQSEGVLIDMLSDANGVSFHRFQLMSWTLVLGGVFIVNTYIDLNMPVFDQTLMGLLGLSAATYLGLKVPEPTVPPK